MFKKRRYRKYARQLKWNMDPHACFSCYVYSDTIVIFFNTLHQEMFAAHLLKFHDEEWVKRQVALAKGARSHEPIT